MSFRFVSRIKQFLQGLRGGGPHEDVKMQNETNGAGDAVNGDRQQLHLVIIGAGLAGLGATVATKVANPYHQVTVLESVKELAEVGVRTISHLLLSMAQSTYPYSDCAKSTFRISNLPYANKT